MSEQPRGGHRDPGFGGCFLFPPFEFDPDTGVLHRANEETLLPPRASEVLTVLLENAGRLVSKDDLLDAVWDEAYVTESSLTHFISLLRKALGDDTRDPRYIQTLHRRGYRFIADVERRFSTAARSGDAAFPEVTAVEPRSEAGHGVVETRGVLQSGSRIGNFEIIEVVGAGAMGTVYRARDRILNRYVAIKALPAAFADDTHRIAELRREAELLASVAHPNIAAIHSLEEVDGITFPVLELVEGETLEHRLRAGPLPVAEALAIAAQIARAIESAHGRGVIHRDLKPANIKFTSQGQVKVLDFGLATGLQVLVPTGNAERSPASTIAIKGSWRGSIVGTTAYMSPEQARGRAVDGQADVWSFGCVLYEMLTGRRPFRGETITDTLVAILEREPDLDALPAASPSALRSLVARCLCKESLSRLHHIGDARIEIEEMIARSEGVSTRRAVGVSEPTVHRQAILWTIATATVLAAGSLIWAILLSPKPPITRLVLPAPEGSLGFRASSNGRSLVYAAESEGRRRLYHRPLALDTAAPIDGTDAPAWASSMLLSTGAGAGTFAISPDGQEVAFWSPADLQLRKVPIGGGAVVPLAEVRVRRVSGMAWGRRAIVLSAGADGLLSVPPEGGEARPIHPADAGPREYQWPHLLPGERGLVAVERRGAPLSFAIVAIDLDTGIVTDLGLEGTYPRYSSSGHLVFARPEGRSPGSGRRAAGELFAAPFDADHLEVTGPAVPIGQNVAVYSRGYAAFEVSDDGSLFFTAAQEEIASALVRVDAAGNSTTLSALRGPFRTPTVSPDGTKVAYRWFDDANRIWVHDLERDSSNPLSPGDGYLPSWSADGEFVYYGSQRGLARQRADFTVAEEEILVPADDVTSSAPFEWEGRFVVFARLDDSRFWRDFDLWQVPLDGSGDPAPLVASEGHEHHGRVSPDGNWLAYHGSIEERQVALAGLNVYVRSLTDGSRYQISSGGGRFPSWSADGTRLFYLSDDAKMMEVTIRREPELHASLPRPLFDWPYSTDGRQFDLFPDGTFLAVQEQSQGWPPTAIRVVLNWSRELRERVPLDR